MAAGGYVLDPRRWGVDPHAEGYLLNAAQNLGWVAATGFGPAPLTWAEIKAYGDCTGDLINPWEFQTVRDMSEAYLAGYTSKDGIDPAKWLCYEGCLLPLVLPANRDATRLLIKSMEA